MTTLNKVLLIFSSLLSVYTVFQMFFGKDVSILPFPKKDDTDSDKGKTSKQSKKSKQSEKSDADSKMIQAYRPMEMSGTLYWIILGVISLLAILIRVYAFGETPGGFNQDGAMAAVDANALAHYGTDRFGMYHPVHLTAWGYGQMSCLLSYLMVPFIKLFGLNAITARLPQLIISLAGIICLYLFIKDVFDEKMALVVAFFVAINPWHILQSRWALDCNLFPHFFIIAIYLLHLALHKKRKKLFLVLSMVCFGLSMYCYGIAIYTIPLFLVIACIYLFVTKKITLIDVLLSIVAYLLVGGPFILTMAVNFFGWETITTPFFTIPYFPDSVRSNDILFFCDDRLAQFTQNAKSLLSITLYQNKDLPWNDVQFFGTMYLFSMPFAFVGLLSLLKRYRKNAGAVLVLFFFITGIWCGLVTNGVNINRLNVIYYSLIILIGMGIYEIIHCVKLPSLKHIILTVYLLCFLFFADTYFSTYAQDMKYYFFDDLGNALSSVKEIDTDCYYISANGQLNGSTQTAEILTMFYHDIDARYYQGEKEIEGELPYSQKYIYYTEMPAINTDENAAYVVLGDEIGYFDSTLYDFIQYGFYYVVTKK